MVQSEGDEPDEHESEMGVNEAVVCAEKRRGERRRRRESMAGEGK